MKTIKEKLTLILVIITLMLISWWFLEISIGSAIDKSNKELSIIITAEARFSHILLSEMSSMKNENDFHKLMSQMKNFGGSCGSCHAASRNNLVDERIEFLRDYHITAGESGELKENVGSSLINLIHSVRYIHKHHIAWMKNLLRRNITEQDYYKDAKPFVRAADEKGSELEIISHAVDIQMQLVLINEIFQKLNHGRVPSGIETDFNEAIASFLQDVNSFEDLSLDAQDGLLVEELLEKGRLFEKSFSHLLELIRHEEKLTKDLDINRDNIVTLMGNMKKSLSEKRLDILSLGKKLRAAVFILVLLMALSVLISGRKIIERITAVVKETGKIQDDSSYRIDIDENIKDEFHVVFSALNSMAAKVDDRYKTMLESIQDGVFIVLDNKLQYANEALARMIGYTPDEITGRDFNDFIAPEYLDFVNERYKRRIAGYDEVNQYDTALLHKNGEDRILVTFHTGIMDYQGQKAGTGTVKDISELKKTEQEKNELTSRLQQSQKMEAIGTLAGGIAHDFNNILGAILGFTELSLMKINHKDPIKGHLEQIMTAGARAKELVQQILSFSRRGEQHFKPTNLAELVDEAMNLIRASLPSTIEIKIYIQDSNIYVPAESTKIHQVIMNLCANAAHALEDEPGILSVKLEIVSETDFVPIGLEPGRYARLIVKDNGVGMPPEIKDRIFEPYFTTRRRGRGTGMGLATVHGIIKNHNGAIFVQSSPGMGAEISVYLPLIDGKGEYELEQNKPALESKPVNGREKILFVDDEPNIVDLWTNALEGLGYNVNGFTSSRDALYEISINSANYDLVITDQTMPKLTGTQLAREILRIRSDIPIILCTGFSESVTEDLAKQIGIKHFLAKPLEINRFSNIIRQTLDKN